MNLTELKTLIAAKTGIEPKPSGKGYICRCPAHEDKTASLSIGTGREGPVLNCHAGCSFEAVIGALGIKPAELFHSNGRAKNGKPNRTEKPKMFETYPYHDAEGKLQYEVCRYVPKGFRQRRPDTATPGIWIWDLKGVDRVPYRLVELLTAVKAGETVFVAEGEKDVATLVKNGFQATCNAAGTGVGQLRSEHNFKVEVRWLLGGGNPARSCWWHITEITLDHLRPSLEWQKQRHDPQMAKDCEAAIRKRLRAQTKRKMERAEQRRQLEEVAITFSDLTS